MYRNCFCDTTKIFIATGTLNRVLTENEMKSKALLDRCALVTASENASGKQLLWCFVFTTGVTVNADLKLLVLGYISIHRVDSNTAHQSSAIITWRNV